MVTIASGIKRKHDATADWFDWWLSNGCWLQW